MGKRKYITVAGHSIKAKVILSGNTEWEEGNRSYAHVSRKHTDLLIAAFSLLGYYRVSTGTSMREVMFKGGISGLHRDDKRCNWVITQHGLIALGVLDDTGQIMAQHREPS